MPTSLAELSLLESGESGGDCVGGESEGEGERELEEARVTHGRTSAKVGTIIL
jgi:hypothetical protein